MVDIFIKMLAGDFPDVNGGNKFSYLKKRFKLVVAGTEKNLFKKYVTYNLDDIDKVEKIDSLTQTGFLMGNKTFTVFKLKFKDGKKFKGQCDSALFAYFEPEDDLADF